MNEDIAVLVPAYQAASVLARTIESLRAAGFDPAQIIVVDDGSTDRTSEVARRCGVDLLRHERNRGKGAAQKTGFHRVLERGFAACITIDADGQHAATEIDRFTAAFRSGLDVVVGTRMADLRGMPFDRFMTNKLTSVTVSLLGRARVTDSQSGFRLLGRAVLARLKLRTNRYDTESEMLCTVGRMGFRVGEVPITTRYVGTRSFINPVLDTYRFLRVAVRALWR